jgi:hypothetical protein
LRSFPLTNSEINFDNLDYKHLSQLIEIPKFSNINSIQDIFNTITSFDTLSQHLPFFLYLHQKDSSKLQEFGQVFYKIFNFYNLT